MADLSGSTSPVPTIASVIEEIARYAGEIALVHFPSAVSACALSPLPGWRSVLLDNAAFRKRAYERQYLHEAYLAIRKFDRESPIFSKAVWSSALPGESK